MPCRSRRPLRERLQRVRPHLAGDGAGRAGIPQRAARHQPFLCPHRRRRHGPATVDVTATAGPDVHHRYTARFSTAGRRLQQRPGVQAMEEVAARPPCPPATATNGPAPPTRKRGAGSRGLHFRFRRRAGLPLPGRPVRELGRSRSPSCWRCLWASSERCALSGCAPIPIDIYTQIGIVTLIGLAAKNAILIVEFARARHEAGTLQHAAEAARLRAPRFRDLVRVHSGESRPCCSPTGRRGSRRSLRHRGLRRHERGDVAGDFFIVPVLFAVIQRIAARKPKPGTEPVAEAQ